VLEVSDEARALCREADLVDLHIDTFIPMRLYGYDPYRRHGGPGWLFGQWDLPRAADSGLDGAMWSITTNPFRSERGRWQTLARNLERLAAFTSASGDRLRLAADVSQYRAARAAGAHAVIPAIQGGNALDAGVGDVTRLPAPGLVRVTLLHLTPSKIGAPSYPLHVLRGHKGLTLHGRRMVEALDGARVFIDVAHLHARGIDDVLDVHDQSLPLMASHTGVDGAHRLWRNLSDDHVRAVADTGGVVGIVTAALYLGRRRGRTGVRRFVDHVEHVIRVGGEDTAAIGTDYDGFILPFAEVGGAHTYPSMVDEMLRRGWTESRVRKVMGGNFLRAWADLRPPRTDPGLAC
jgi:membrane dipeptidase